MKQPRKIHKLNTAKAYKYYCLGLNSKEIAKLLDCSYRTIQNVMTTEKWKAKRAEQLEQKKEKPKPQA